MLTLTKAPKLILQSSLLLLIFAFSSCAPRVQFLGDAQPATTKIDVFYDAKDVEKEYRTIGQLTHTAVPATNRYVELVKEAMIKKAKEKGGDGIIFIDVFTDTQISNINKESRHQLSISAKVIKYKI